MYGIRNRPAFVNYVYGSAGSKENTASPDYDKSKRYFSSLDAEIYFSDYYVDEIVHIQYSVSQNSLPLYGYNSYVYDEVALGNRIIQGSFTINFTSPGYLFNLLEKINQDSGGYENNHNVNKESEGQIEEEKNENAESQVRQERAPLWKSTFDIDVMFGEENTIGNSSHVVLEGVVIVGSSMQVDISGNPIAESYTFIARDVKTVD